MALAIMIGGGLVLIGFVEVLNWRSQRQVEGIVRELVPGTAYQTAVERLGMPVYEIVDREEMVHFNQFHAPKGGRTLAGEKLHVFSHKGIPFRFVLVFTDAESLIVRQASWEGM